MRIIALLTYKKFMKKYGLRIGKTKNGKRTNKSMIEMSQEIYNYEKNNIKNIKKGLYFNV